VPCGVRSPKPPSPFLLPAYRFPKNTPRKIYPETFLALKFVSPATAGHLTQPVELQVFS
jgi:hypothetical protein